MRIAHSHHYAGMPEQLFDDGERNSTKGELGREGMTKGVPSDFADSSLLADASQFQECAVAGVGLALPVREYVSRSVLPAKQHRVSV